MKFLNLLKKIKDTDVYHNNKSVYDTLNDFNQDQYVANGTGKGYSADFINKMLSSWTNNNYTGSVMSSNNGSVQSYSSINIFVNDAGTLAYMTGTLYNNHTTAGEAKVTFNSILRPSTNQSPSNIVAFYNNTVIAENTNISTDGKITITAYGSANGNSRHTFIGVLIPLK